MKKNKNELAELRQSMLERAGRDGLTEDYKFMSMLRVFDQQMKTLVMLEETLAKEEAFVTKEYVKGRENIYVHPAIKEYNNTANSANRTMATLLKIISEHKVEEPKDELDEFLS